MSELWKKYEDYYFKISSYKLVLGTTILDSETIAPKDGDDYRNERIAYVAGEIYSLETSEELMDLLAQLEKDDSLDDKQKRIVNYHLKDLKKILCIPKDVYVEQQKLFLKSQQVWQQAKQNNDYQLFKPYLEKVIAMEKRLLQYREDGWKGYDALLDDFEPGMTMEKYDRFFNLMKEKLVPLINKINKGKQIDDEFVYQDYPIHQQEELMSEIMKHIDFNFGSGVLLTSEHPFTDMLQKHDVRITTHYYQNNLISSIYSVIHEAGHANYNHQVDDDLAQTYVFDNMSSGMHESQSRLYENYLGRNYHFWDSLFDKMKEIFPQQLKDVDQQAFYKAVNKATPSLIRTDADELTYPLHILIRYEIEKGLFDGSISFENLENVWNDKYEQYLGIRPQKASEGILQDIHWSDGSFGYFPTYALGSAYAAQFMAAMAKDLDVDECLALGKFTDIKEWLRSHIHRYGGLYTPEEIILMATGEPFNPEYYVNYLIEKYSKLYEIGE